MITAPKIRPVSDLRNKFAEISKLVNETSEPVFLTKNGHGDMVVISIEAYERQRFQSEIFFKLKEAQIEVRSTDVRCTHKDVIQGLRETLNDEGTSDV